MIEMGIGHVNTAKRLGHADSQMTLDTYNHTSKTGEYNLLQNSQNISIRLNKN